MIKNITNTPRVNTIVQSQANRSQQIRLNQDYDKVSFTGVSSLTRIRSKAETRELIELLHRSCLDTRIRKNPNFKPTWLSELSDKVNHAIDRFFKLSLATDSNTISAVAKKGNKLVGGYTMYLDHEKGAACVEFITLAPELKNTKAGKDILLSIGKNIYEHLKDTSIVEIAWQKNQDCMNLFKKLRPIYTESHSFSPDEHIIFVDAFGKSINDLATKYHFQGI